MAGVMEKFDWPVKPGMTVDSEPKVTVMRFGDGYAQRRPAGLNSQLKRYTVSVKVANTQQAALQSFLSRHGGVKAFVWSPPLEGRQVKVVCAKWKSTVGLLNTVVTATFEEVV